LKAGRCLEDRDPNRRGEPLEEPFEDFATARRRFPGTEEDELSESVRHRNILIPPLLVNWESRPLTGGTIDAGADDWGVSDPLHRARFR
jgi:hypothetical protein